ncbi:MAG: hypothetical protein AABY32_00745 [Nanoarchaeota archaeon]
MKHVIKISPDENYIEYYRESRFALYCSPYKIFKGKIVDMSVENNNDNSACYDRYINLFRNDKEIINHVDVDARETISKFNVPCRKAIRIYSI